MSGYDASERWYKERLHRKGHGDIFERMWAALIVLVGPGTIHERLHEVYSQFMSFSSLHYYASGDLSYSPSKQEKVNRIWQMLVRDEKGNGPSPEEAVEGRLRSQGHVRQEFQAKSRETSGEDEKKIQQEDELVNRGRRLGLWLDNYDEQENKPYFDAETLLEKSLEALTEDSKKGFEENKPYWDALYKIENEWNLKIAARIKALSEDEAWDLAETTLHLFADLMSRVWEEPHIKLHPRDEVLRDIEYWNRERAAAEEE